MGRQNAVVLNERFVILGAALDFLGVIGYAWQTAVGRTKPNRVTWVLWALAPLIAFAAEIGDGVGPQALLTFVVGFGPLLVVLVSFLNRGAYVSVTRLDVACGVCSVVALVLWALTRTGTVAIVLSILADCLAALPTLLKSYRNPETEHPGVYILGGVGAVITLLTVKVWSFDVVGFPIYVAVMCVILSGVIIYRQRVTVSRAPAH